MIRAALISLLLAAVTLLGGCGESVTTIPRADLEQRIKASLEKEVGAVDSVTCPSDLAGVVGTTVVCDVAAQGQQHQVTVRVTAVDGDKIQYNLTPTEATSGSAPGNPSAPTVSRAPGEAQGGQGGQAGPPFAPRADVEQYIRDTLEPDVGAVDSVRCPGDLEGVVGARMTCDVRAQGQDDTVTVTVSSVDGNVVHFTTDDYTGANQRPDNPDADPVVVPKTELELRIMDALEPQVGAVDAVGCPGDLEGVVGTVTVCSVSAQGQDQDYEVQVTAVNGTEVEFSLEAVA